MLLVQLQEESPMDFDVGIDKLEAYQYLEEEPLKGLQYGVDDHSVGHDVHDVHDDDGGGRPHTMVGGRKEVPNKVELDNEYKNDEVVHMHEEVVGMAQLEVHYDVAVAHIHIHIKEHGKVLEG